jgi:hypothetical protein
MEVEEEPRGIKAGAPMTVREAVRGQVGRWTSLKIEADRCDGYGEHKEGRSKEQQRAWETLTQCRKLRAQMAARMQTRKGEEASAAFTALRRRQRVKKTCDAQLEMARKGFDRWGGNRRRENPH